MAEHMLCLLIKFLSTSAFCVPGRYGTDTLPTLLLPLITNFHRVSVESSLICLLNFSQFALNIIS